MLRHFLFFFPSPLLVLVSATIMTGTKMRPQFTHQSVKFTRGKSPRSEIKISRFGLELIRERKHPFFPHVCCCTVDLQNKAVPD